jgi:hypothetical protein
MNLEIEFVPGEKYRNRRGTYEVLELLPAGRMKVRYLDDDVVAEFDQAQQSRIIANIQMEEKFQEQQAAVVAKPVKATARQAAQARSKPVAPVARPAEPRPSASPSVPSNPPSRPPAAPAPVRPTTTPARRSTTSAETLVDLPSSVPIRTSFEKLEVFRLLTFIGFGNLDGQIWFIGTNDTGSEDGNVNLSERIALPEYQNELADTEILKQRYRTESNYFYGNPAWRYANYLTTHLLEPAENHTETFRREYFTNRFGALDGPVLLTDILPLPSRNLNNQERWVYRNTAITDSPYYNDVLRDTQRIQDDQFLGRPTRLKRLSEIYNTLKLEGKSPRFIFCYGRAAQWKYFKEIFPSLTAFTEIELKVAPDKERVAKLAVSKDQDNGTLVILLPGLTPQEGATEFFLDHVVSIMKGMSRQADQ